MTAIPAVPNLTIPAAYTLLTYEEAAARARATVTTVWRWVDAGKLPVVRIGARVFIRRAALDAYIDPQGTVGLGSDDLEGIDRGALLTYTETFRVLRVSRFTLDRLTAEQQIAVLRVGNRNKVRLGAVVDLIDDMTVPATAGPLTGRNW